MLLRSFLFLGLSSIVAATLVTLAIAGEAGRAAASTINMSTANWLMAMPVVLVLAAALHIHFRGKRLIIRHRTTIVNPDQDHSTRRYHRNAGIPLSAILPPPPTISIAALSVVFPTSLSDSRRQYRFTLNWVNNAFGSLRVFTYVPTILTLWASADSNQYNLLTWCTWVLANASLTASIYEQNGRKVDNFVIVNICNTFMCSATAAVIFYLR